MLERSKHHCKLPHSRNLCGCLRVGDLYRHLHRFLDIDGHASRAVQSCSTNAAHYLQSCVPTSVQTRLAQQSTQGVVSTCNATARPVCAGLVGALGSFRIHFHNLSHHQVSAKLLDPDPVRRRLLSRGLQRCLQWCHYIAQGASDNSVTCSACSCSVACRQSTKWLPAIVSTAASAVTNRTAPFFSAQLPCFSVSVAPRAHQSMLVNTGRQPSRS
jgi:hypothetical protein